MSRIRSRNVIFWCHLPVVSSIWICCKKTRKIILRLLSASTLLCFCFKVNADGPKRCAYSVEIFEQISLKVIALSSDSIWVVLSCILPATDAPFNALETGLMKQHLHAIHFKFRLWKKSYYNIWNRLVLIGNPSMLLLHLWP